MKKPDNIWHPFTQMKTDTNTLLITKTKGVSLFDDMGKEYIDCCPIVCEQVNELVQMTKDLLKTAKHLLSWQKTD